MNGDGNGDGGGDGDGSNVDSDVDDTVQNGLACIHIAALNDDIGMLGYLGHRHEVDVNQIDYVCDVAVAMEMEMAFM